LTGGPSRPILGNGGTALAWSPDGERLTYMKIVASSSGAWMGDVIVVADRVGGDPREICNQVPGQPRDLLIPGAIERCD
jgi:hypothetical protein